jgi:hypothetical protein
MQIPVLRAALLGLALVVAGFVAACAELEVTEGPIIEDPGHSPNSEGQFL